MPYKRLYNKINKWNAYARRTLRDRAYWRRRGQNLHGYGARKGPINYRKRGGAFSIGGRYY